MALTGTSTGVVILLLHGCTVMAVDLYSSNTNPEVQEYQRVELSCQIKQTYTENPRIEWKKIRNGDTSYVYFHGVIQGDLKNRAEIKDGISLVIYNATRTDNGKYRCEVAAADDPKRFAEISINLTVTVKPVIPQCRVPKSVPVGKSAVLHCRENEGYPSSVYRWYRNSDALPEESRSNPKFLNSSFTVNVSSGTLVFAAVNKRDMGQYYCIASNAAGSARCDAQLLEVYDLNIGGIVGGVLVVVLVLVLITVGMCCAYQKGYFVTSSRSNGQSFMNSSKTDGMNYLQTSDEVTAERCALAALLSTWCQMPTPRHGVVLLSIRCQMLSPRHRPELLSTWCQMAFPRHGAVLFCTWCQMATPRHGAE